MWDFQLVSDVRTGRAPKVCILYIPVAKRGYYICVSNHRESHTPVYTLSLKCVCMYIYTAVVERGVSNTHNNNNNNNNNNTHSQDARLLETLLSLTGSDSIEGFSLTLVYRRDGIVNLDFINLVCEWPKTAELFKQAVNALTYCMLHAHAAPVVLYRKK